jgi:RNA polymerase sigma-70 factor (ECF subfamily)
MAFMDERRRLSDPVSGGPRRFRTTRWSLVVAARGGDLVEARQALSDLCAAYWYPLYAFVRRKGCNSDDARDVVQGFIAQLIERGDLASVDRQKGKFRSFLMASCEHFLAHERERARARKRGGGRVPVSIDRLEAEGRYAREVAHGLTAERLYERRWALTVLGNVLERLGAEMLRSGRSRQFEALRPALLGSAERVSYARIAAELGSTEDAARAAAHRLRRRYRVLLRDEVAHTVSDPAEVEAEIQSLFTALAD